MKTPHPTLAKREILRGYRVFSEIISSGSTIQKGPVRCFYRTENGDPSSLRVGFAVSGIVKNAVSRNRVRRWMKEAYRIRKTGLLERWARVSIRRRCDVVFLFNERSVPTLNHRVRNSIDSAISSLLEELRRRCLETQ